jgi:hypothetical protein
MQGAMQFPNCTPNITIIKKFIIEKENQHYTLWFMLQKGKVNSGVETLLLQFFVKIKKQTRKQLQTQRIARGRTLHCKEYFVE